MTGFFITFEGGEGVGKTTQIKLLAAKLRAAGYEVLTTREPGGTPAAEKIRDLLSDPALGPAWSPESQLLLLYAARASHLKDIIIPALQSGKIVISDRFTDSTRVYQGYLQKLDHGFIDRIDAEIVGEHKPDLTLILDIPGATTIERVAARGGAIDHYDEGNEAFHETIRQGFLDIAAKNPDRCVVIDAVRSIDEIAADLEKAVLEKINAAPARIRV